MRQRFSAGHALSSRINRSTGRRAASPNRRCASGVQSTSTIQAARFACRRLATLDCGAAQRAEHSLTDASGKRDLERAARLIAQDRRYSSPLAIDAAILQLNDALRSGAYAVAEVVLPRALGLAYEQGLADRAVYAATYLVQLHYLRGECARAASEARQCVVYAQRLGLPAPLARVRWWPLRSSCFVATGRRKASPNVGGAARRARLVPWAAARDRDGPSALGRAALSQCAANRPNGGEAGVANAER